MLRLVVLAKALTTTNKSKGKWLEPFNKEIKEIKTLLKKRAEITHPKISIKEFSQSGAFCSLQQIFTLLWQSHDKEEILSKLQCMQHITTIPLDPYDVLK